LTSRYLRQTSALLRLLPCMMQGKGRLARLLLGRMLDGQDIELHDRDGSVMTVPSLREPVAFHLLIDGLYEPDTLAFLLGRLKPGNVFVDVGANVGAFTIPVARKLAGTGYVLSLEASPSVFPYLRSSVERNHLTNVHLRQCASIDKNVDDLHFYEAPPQKFGMGALAPQFEGDTVSVLGRTLDSLLAEEGIKQVHLLKVDVEGFEAAVFRGARGLLTGQAPPVIVFEFCDWAEARVPHERVGDAQRLLLDWGYRVWRLSDFVREKPCLPRVLTSGFDMLVATRS
jgi:FkbM family methyltransferase